VPSPDAVATQDAIDVILTPSAQVVLCKTPFVGSPTHVLRVLMYALSDLFAAPAVARPFYFDKTRKGRLTSEQGKLRFADDKGKELLLCDASAFVSNALLSVDEWRTTLAAKAKTPFVKAALMAHLADLGGWRGLVAPAKRFNGEALAYPPAATSETLRDAEHPADIYKAVTRKDVPDVHIKKLKALGAGVYGDGPPIDERLRSSRAFRALIANTRASGKPVSYALVEKDLLRIIRGSSRKVTLFEDVLFPDGFAFSPSTIHERWQFMMTLDAALSGSFDYSEGRLAPI
jgi:hypothetical protein